MSDGWWRGSVIYQIYPRSFADSNGDGVGDLCGITERLEYVASLGVDGIWLSPFFLSPMTDFGYDVADYRDVDPLFGTLADFDMLLARAHALGLKVLIDMVWAHTSDRHPWFVESRSATSWPRADWYVWAPPRADGTPPNNWLSVFGGGAWTWEPRRRQYYLHHFLPSQPKLNLRNPAVLNELLDIGTFWLERGVDGFRLDAVDFLVHDEALRDNPPASLADMPIKPFQMQRHLYDSGGTSVLPLIERMRARSDRYPGTVMVAEVGGETTDISSLARAAAYVGDGENGIHGAYSLSQMKSRGDAAAIRDAIREVEQRLPGAGMVWAFSNHDVERVVSRWGDGSQSAAKMFMALLLSLRGGAFVYQGEELGLPEAEVPFERLQDPYGQNYWPDFKGRDGSRTPMPWMSTQPNAGFSPADTTCWLPIPDAHYALAVDRQEADRDSVLHAWRRFLQWRKRHPALLGGTLELYDVPDPFVAFVRSGGGERLLCAFNVAPQPGDLVLPEGSLAAVDGFGWSGEGRSIHLAGYGVYFAHMDDKPTSAADKASPRIAP
jgi:alpha-glucosidase